MIRIRMYEHGRLFLNVLDTKDMATSYIMYAQLNGYGIEIEVVGA